MSRNGKYACIYYPYHYMGLETPVSILLGDLMEIGTHPECRQVSILAGVAKKDLPKGTVLTVAGHHHSIEGLVPELLEREKADLEKELSERLVMMRYFDITINEQWNLDRIIAAVDKKCSKTFTCNINRSNNRLVLSDILLSKA